MKRFLIFVCVLFVFGAGHAEDIICPAGSYINDDDECVLCEPGYYCTSDGRHNCHENYPNSAPGASVATDCYSDWQTRICATPSECAPTTCQYRAYIQRKAGKWMDGIIKDGCTEDDCSSLPSVALPGYYVDGEICKVCPENTYSTGGENAKCEPCPNGATTPSGAMARAECTRILNYRVPNANTPTRIYLNGYKNTSPALAFGIGNDIFYAGMMPVVDKSVPGMYIGYNNKTYMIISNTKRYDNAFYIITTPNTDSFGFKTMAYGDFTVDWGDGNIETFGDTYQITHTYDTPGKYTIEIRGTTTGYAKSKKAGKWVYKTIEFTDKLNILGIGGSLGAVFPTLDDGTNPNFDGLFSGAVNLTGTIPNGLFRGITGSPADSIHIGMFNSVFSGCSGLVGQIPVGLFGDLSGDVGTDTFVNAFSGCTNLTGPAARNVDGTPLYDIEYNGKTWYEQSPSAFTDMYTGSGISDL